MTVLFNEKVFERGLSGTGTVETGPELFKLLAQGERYYVTARVTQVTAAGFTLVVALQISNDGIWWTTKGGTPIINGVSLTQNVVNNLAGTDLSSAAVGGGLARLQVSLTGTNPNAYVEIWVCGRTAN